MKLSPFVLAAALVAGCSSGSEKSAAGESSTTTQHAGKAVKVFLVFDEGGRGDKSFNDSAYRGVERAKSELGADTRYVDSKSQADYITNFESLAEDKPDLIIGVGISMDQAMKEAAKRHPDQKFAIIDVTSDSPNVMGVVFKEEEGSFLAGVLAGMTTKTNKIGFVGGKSIDLIKKFEYGFRAGIKTVNPSCQVSAKYTEDWADVAKGQEAAIALFDGGADIVYHASGKCGIGVIKAAKERNLYAIGVDSDQDGEAPGNVLTSMVKGVDNAVFEAAKRVKDGTFKGENLVLGIKEGGVGLSEMKYTKNKVSPEALAAVERYKEMIKANAFQVPATAEQFASFSPPSGK
jgi:basic membrane protein A